MIKFRVEIFWYSFISPCYTIGDTLNQFSYFSKKYSVSQIKTFQYGYWVVREQFLFNFHNNSVIRKLFILVISRFTFFLSRSHNFLLKPLLKSQKSKNWKVFVLQIGLNIFDKKARNVYTNLFPNKKYF